MTTKRIGVVVLVFVGFWAFVDFTGAGLDWWLRAALLTGNAAFVVALVTALAGWVREP